MPFNQKPEIFWHLIIYLCIKLHYSSLISFLKSIFLRSVSHSFHCRLFIYLGFLISGIYYTKRKKKQNKKTTVPSVLTLAVALVIPLHGYFMIMCLRLALLILRCLCYVWWQLGNFLLFCALPFTSEEFLRSVVATKITKFCVGIFILLSPFFPN